MPITNSRKPGLPRKTTSILNRTLTRSKVQTQAPFLKEKVVPAGTYTATIVSVSESVTQGGDEAIDVAYKLLDTNGRTFEAKERLVWDSHPYNLLVNHLIDTGLLIEGAAISDVVGICEEVTVSYPYKGAFGSFQNRQPCQQKSAVPLKSKKQELLAEDAEDEVDEDYDLLEDDD